MKFILGLVRSAALLVSGCAATIGFAVGSVLPAMLAGWLWLAKDLPDPRNVWSPHSAPCPDGFQPAPLSLPSLPAVVPAAFISTEDANFMRTRTMPSLRLFSSPARFERSLADQQLGVRRTLTRMFKGLVQADRISLALSKGDILTAYLDQVYLGHGNVGIQCASRFYFSKTPAELAISEAALLAAMVKGPSNYDPLRQPERAMARRAIVINTLLAEGAISVEQAAEANRTALLPNKTGREIAPPPG